MTATRTICDSCGHKPRKETDHCPSCGTKEPWVLENTHDFEDVELPLVFSIEHYNDTYGLWKSFTESAFGAYNIQGSQIANVPDGLPKMKYCIVEVYFKLTEDYELEGPFLERKEAREA